ncbi:MAG TPA: sodium ion-translocating decarboxylase subunit beta [Candidatus Ornithoclostridium faecavium]|nr:sodium ion-translocating decarboxylase subunit beta [Candidatus Ornithoclostridium faecavium]
MLVIACVLIYLAVYKEFEPNLLLAIGFGMFIINIPGTYNVLYGTLGYTFFDANNLSQALTLEDGTVISGTVAQLAQMLNIDTTGMSMLDKVAAITAEVEKLFPGITVTSTHEVVADQGIFYYLYKGVEWVIYPPLIFLGIGAMTDFGPLIANPKSLILGAAAQLGIFLTFIIAINIGFTGEEASAIAIIGGADGPTAIYVTTKLASHLLPSIAVAAYSYMALIKIIQPPIMKLMTTKKERAVVMEQLRPVSKTEKVVFPIIVTLVVGVILPSAVPLLGMLMLGNLFKESEVVPRLTNTSKNELINIITILLGVLVGTKATAEVFITVQTLKIIIIGVFAFAGGTAGGLLLGKVMYWVTKGKVNPLIGSAGVSAVPMAARISHNVGQEENPRNYLLMHAMGPNVAGVIGSAVAAGVLLALFGK